VHRVVAAADLDELDAAPGELRRRRVPLVGSYEILGEREE
jgi:hypothetical protein